MAKLLKLRRGTTSQHSSFTGAEGEVTVDTTKDTVVVHDGSTAGGHPLVKENTDVTSTGISNNVVDEDNLKISNAGSNGQFLQKQSGNTGGLTWAAVSTDVVGDTSPQLGGDLDVNTKNIVLGDSSDGATDDTIKFGAGTDLSIYSDGLNGTFLIPNSGNLFIKQGSSTLATFSGASNQIDFNEDVLFIGAASNGMWDKSANKFVANVQGDLTGTADTAAAITVADGGSTAATVYPLFAGSGSTATGSALAPKTDTGLTYNSSTGLLTATGLTLSGNLTVNGTTTTIDTTNTKVKDNLLELNSGATSNANDSGILIERGSTGDNAIIAWDESADKFIVGTTTAANDATGDLTIATGTLVANVEGTATTATTATNVTVADESSDTTCFPTFVTAATGDLPPKTGSNLTFNSSTGVLAATKVSDDIGDLRIMPSVAYGGAGTVNLLTSHSGKVLLMSGNINIGQFMTTNMAVSIINITASDITIGMNLGNLYWTADGSSASRTLASRGMATIWFADWNTAYISGSGLS